MGTLTLFDHPVIEESQDECKEVCVHHDLDEAGEKTSPRHLDVHGILLNVKDVHHASGKLDRDVRPKRRESRTKRVRDTYRFRCRECQLLGMELHKPKG